MEGNAEVFLRTVFDPRGRIMLALHDSLVLRAHRPPGKTPKGVRWSVSSLSRKLSSPSSTMPRRDSNVVGGLKRGSAGGMAI